MSIAPWLSDIRFWIVVLFCVRLVGITYAPLEVNHNWRQTTVTMVARNFYEVDPNPYFPRLDFGGAAEGISAMEFPFLNYLIYVVSLIFGYEHWYGRLINLVITSGGLWFFHQLIAGLFNQRRAFIATLLLGTSLWFTFGRKIMPDTMAISFILMSLYCAWRYLAKEQSHWIYAIGAGLLFTLGALSKLPAALPMVLMPLFFITWGNSKQKIILAAIYAVCLLPVLHWYWIWTPHLTATYGMTHFFMGKGLSIGYHEILQNIGLSLERIFVGPFKYIGGIAFVCAIATSLLQKNKAMTAVLVSATLALVALMCKSGETFYAHDYYILPYIPVMALTLAYLIEQLPKRYASALLVVIVAESTLNQFHDLRWKPIYNAHLELETLMNRFTSQDARIAINCAPNPSTMYFAHRKGWICTNEELAQERSLTHMQEQGLTHVVICKDRFGSDLELPSQLLLFEDAHFRLYQLQPTESTFGIAGVHHH